MENNLEQPTNQQPPVQKQTISEIPHSKSKSKLILLTVILLLIIGVGAYLFKANNGKYFSQYFQQPTPTPIPRTFTSTSNLEGIWIPYVNAFGLFEIKHPMNWEDEYASESGDMNSSSHVRILNPGVSNGNKGNYLPNINITVDKLETNRDYEENSLIAGVKAYRTSLPSGIQSAIESIEFKRNGFHYKIDLLYDDGRTQKKPYDSGIYNKEAVDVYNKILASFKFIDTSTWKTFTNKDYGFSFKYPSKFTITEKKEIFQSENFDNAKVTVTEYSYHASTGILVNDQPELSGFRIDVEPTFGKTITQEYKGKQGMGGLVDVVPITVPSGADEAAKLINIGNGYGVYRVGDNFISMGSFQNYNVLPDWSDSIDPYNFVIFNTLTFK